MLMFGLDNGVTVGGSGDDGGGTIGATPGGKSLNRVRPMPMLSRTRAGGGSFKVVT